MSLNSLLRWLKPREMVFFDLLDQSAQNGLEAARFFEQGLRAFDPAQLPELRRRMKEFEHTGDDFTHQILERLNTTFVTPIEREDIQTLAHALDDVIDDLDRIAERLVLYEIQQIRPALQELLSQVVTGCEHLVFLIHSLRSMTDSEGINRRIREVNALENRVDGIYHTSLAVVFKEVKDPIELIKWKELFDTAECAVDRIDAAAQAVGSAFMKNA